MNDGLADLQSSGHPIQRSGPGDVYHDLELTTLPSPNDSALTGVFKLDAFKDMQASLLRWRMVPSVRQQAFETFRRQHNLVPAAFQAMQRMNLSDIVKLLGPGIYRVLSCRISQDQFGLNQMRVNFLNRTSFPKFPSKFGDRHSVDGYALMDALVRQDPNRAYGGPRPTTTDFRRGFDFATTDRRTAAAVAGRHLPTRTRLQKGVVDRGLIVPLGLTRLTVRRPDRFVPGVNYPRAGRVVKKKKHR